MEDDMLWFALILAIIIGVLVGLITRNLKKALMFGAASLIIGVLFSFLILFSGIMGG
jgi:Na+/H+-dicarboxylate symporter